MAGVMWPSRTAASTLAVASGSRMVAIRVLRSDRSSRTAPTGTKREGPGSSRASAVQGGKDGGANRRRIAFRCQAQSLGQAGGKLWVGLCGLALLGCGHFGFLMRKGDQVKIGIVDEARALEPDNLPRLRMEHERRAEIAIFPPPDQFPRRSRPFDTAPEAVSSAFNSLIQPAAGTGPLFFASGRLFWCS